MAKDTPKPRRLKARRTTGRSAGISQSAFAGYGHQQPAAVTKPEQAATDAAADDSKPADSAEDKASQDVEKQD